MTEKSATNKQILNGCNPCFFTMRQEGQSSDETLLGQKQLID